MSLINSIFEQLLNGLRTGSIYALIALGYTMVYGIAKMINFAHGDIIMVGAYVVWLSMTSFGLHPLFSILLAVAVSTLLGVVIEKVAYAPLRSSPRLSLLITAIGISFLLENGFQLIFGAGAKVVPTLISGPTFQIGGASISTPALVTLGVTVVIMIGLTLLVQKTRLGRAMRAVSEDMGAAQLMGVNINTTISFTFALGSALAAVASALYLSSYAQASPTMGSMLGLKAFVAAVLGGIGSLPGAMLGGFVIGLAEALVSAVGLSVWKDGVVFAILIVVLLVRPSGLLGKPMKERV